jgi:succinate dehydrogenase / fumarate reductase membrane anchor subunit
MEALVSGYRKNPVGAHYGLLDWLLQRLTAVVMAVFTVAVAVCLLVKAPASHEELRALFGGSLLRVATLLFLLALFYHAWVGVRDIVMDYIKSAGLRLGLQTLVGVALVFYAIWSVAILWGK